ncbi:hypothetical protein [Winogradskya humida]|uniref:Uncharacterized protein n=1 Tax=Winogradskya humida TaxID=113566 RepID=A0ABQ3ZMG0_9ACTN|nr:hypothetical protein [Actinoplanes humidus]GIE19776.1 hypothetical protein Ahu01nite_028780 [Actinoplanes humidus]
MTDQAELHAALLRLGGRVPDSMLAEARLRLADTGTVIVPDPDGTIELAYTFTPALPDPRTFGNAVPALLDLIGRELSDDLDKVAVRVLERVKEPVALWRAWRTAPEWAASAIPTSRVYVLEVNGPQPHAAAEVMRELAAAGLDAPQVEVYRSGDELPKYTRTARNSGALLWMADAAPAIRVARVYDVVTDGFARFEPGHERLTGADLEQVAEYLEAGAAVLATTGRLPDVIEPARGDVVPMSYRTDGRWLWTESVGYYLRAYGLAPEPDLLAYIRAAGPLRPTPDAAGEHRALATLFQSAAVVKA